MNMNLDVQCRNFGTRAPRAPAQACQSLHFQKITGGPNIIIFCENWHEASFYIKEQLQKYKFEI